MNDNGEGLGPLLTTLAPHWPKALAALVLLILAAVVYGAVLRVTEDRKDRRGKPSGRANNWASKRDLNELIVHAPQPGRLTVMRPNGQRGYLALASDHSAIVLGGSTSGKTRRVVIPNVVTWRGPAVVVSTKDDLYANTYKCRGASAMFAPGANPEDYNIPLIEWSPLDGIRDKLRADDGDGAWTVALMRATAMIKGMNADDVKNGSFWIKSAALNLAPLLLAAALTEDRAPERTMRDVLKWVSTATELRSPLLILDAHDRIPDEAPERVEALMALTGEMISGILGTLQAALAVYNYPAVARASTSTDRFRPAQLLGPNATLHTLYISGDRRVQNELAPIINGLLDEIVEYRFSQANAANRARTNPDDHTPAIAPEHRLLLALDEAANIAPMPDLANLVSQGSSMGITGIYAYQDYSQLVSTQGEQKAMTVLNNVQARIITPAMADTQTLRAVELLLGTTEVARTSTTTAKDSTSHTTSTEKIPLVDAAGIRTLRDGEVIVIYGKHLPFRGRMLKHLQWATDPAWQDHPRPTPAPAAA